MVKIATNPIFQTNHQNKYFMIENTHQDNTSFGYRTVTEQEKTGLVKEVFSSVSSKYDLMNDTMSFGIHRVWKDALVDWMAPKDKTSCLDLAGGTGDIAKRILKRNAGVDVHVVDLTPDMIFEGRNKIGHGSNNQPVSWIVGDGLQLPFKDNQFDYCTIGFGLRNFRNYTNALKEIYRVLKLGGRLLVLEFSNVPNESLRQLYDSYSFKVIPKLGGIIASDVDSYQYLVESIRKFPGQEELKELMAETGFENIRYRNLSFGVVAIHSGWKI